MRLPTTIAFNLYVFVLPVVGQGLRTLDSQSHLMVTADDGVGGETDDSAFDRYVDRALLRKAVSECDAALLTDVALEFAEGEQVLHRIHNSGVASDDLLLKASVLSEKHHDKSTLDRLKIVAASLHKDKLSAELARQEKLGAADRSPNPSFLSADKLGIKEILLLKSATTAIDKAELLDDAPALDRLKNQLEVDSETSATNRSVLLQRVQDAKTHSRPDSATIQLAKLVSSSRGDTFDGKTPAPDDHGIDLKPFAQAEIKRLKEREQKREQSGGEQFLTRFEYVTPDDNGAFEWRYDNDWHDQSHRHNIPYEEYTRNSNCVVLYDCHLRMYVMLTNSGKAFWRKDEEPWAPIPNLRITSHD